MSITNGYCTLAEARAQISNLAATNTTNDAEIEGIVEQVSREIDNYCGRRFHKNSEAEDRYYTTPFFDCLFTDDIVSITKLYTDEDWDRTYEVEWATTDFDLYPLNAALDGHPYTHIKTTPDGDYSFPKHAKAVKITGIFGWNAVPAPIKRACLIQVDRLYRRRDAPFGVTGSAEMGQALVIPKLDPDVEMLLNPYRRLT